MIGQGPKQGMTQEELLMADESIGPVSSYTLAGEWGTGSHLLVVPRIDVSRHSIKRLGKTKRSKAFKKSDFERG